MVATTENAVISNFTIFRDTQNFLVAEVELDCCEGKRRVFGGWVIFSPDLDRTHPKNSRAGDFTSVLMQVAGVASLKDVIGRPVRIELAGGSVRALIHFLDDEVYLCPAERYIAANELTRARRDGEAESFGEVAQ